MLIDTHSHVNFKDYQNDYDEVIQRALTQKIWLINVGADYKTSEKAVNLAQFYAEGVYAAVGLHPIHVQDKKYDFKAYEKLAIDFKVVAIGEIGLDYFHCKRRTKKATEEIRELQKEVFLKQLELGRKINKPLIFHCREAAPKDGQAHQDLIKILKTTITDERGIVHCFSGNWAQAKDYVNMGLLIGFNGIITFSDNYNEIIKKLPLEKIVLETDCPYLTPIPFRGKRNEPAYVKYVAEKIAEIKDLSFKEVAEQTSQNAKNLLKI